MATRKKKYRARQSQIVLLLVLLVTGFCIALSYMDKQGADLDISLPDPSSPDFSITETLLLWVDALFEGDGGNEENSAPPLTGPPSGELAVHYLDMGQADSILIQAPEKTVLIDAGENNQGDRVLRYLKALGVESLDLTIGTHPHSDHIGGLDTVLLGVHTAEIILPELPDKLIPTTRTFTDLLEAIEEKETLLTVAQPGLTYDLGGGALLTILAPAGEYGDLNNYSVVSRLDFGETSFLFTGDIEAEAEQDLLRSGQYLKADVMDAGHHGSKTSSSQAFAEAVEPVIVVISCGLDNSYGHPNREVVERYQAMGADIYRTDLQGTVVIYSDGLAYDPVVRGKQDAILGD